MHIGIDARYLSHGLVGGIHTYLTHFLRELVRLPGDHTISLYADTKRPFELRDLPPHVRVRLLGYRSPLSSVANDLLIGRRMAADGVDVAHFPANYGFAPQPVRVVVTLHDAINVMPLPQIIGGHRKGVRTAVMMTYLHLCSRAAIKRAALVLTVSKHARQEIQRYAAIDAARLRAIYHAPAHDLQPVRDPQHLADVQRRHQLTRPFILADALKNPAVLVRAWGHLAPQLREQYQIVFFSRQTNPLPIVFSAVSRGDARLLIQPSRADLIALYSMAEAFVLPSWIEGFGIPLLEAMTCGAPIIASDRGAIPEVSGDAALLIDAEDHITLARYLTVLLSDRGVADRLRQRGFARAAEFSWHTTATQTLASYYQAASPMLRYAVTKG